LKRLIISDTHIGSKFYKKEELLRLLRTKKYDQLILNGDIIEFLKGPSFTPMVLDIITAIDYSKEIIYVVGNHDAAMAKLVDRSLYNIKFVEEYCFKENGRSFRIEHGDKYETGLIHRRYLMKIISIFQDILERTFGIDLSTWITNLKLKKKRLKRVWDIVDQNSDVDVIIIGHMHVPEVLIWIDEDEKIKTYVNTGDWVQHATYVEIEAGILRLKNFLKE
jgi:UDP-2,3-diacylglucosamine pyrophosphatase LpxH